MEILQRDRKREKQRESKTARWGEGRKMVLRKKERHKINLRKGTVKETLVE